MERVLITGHTGFLGGALYDNLIKEGHDVSGLSKSTGFTFGTLLDSPNVINYDTIYHFASTVNEYGWLHRDDDDIRTNCLGTKQLLEAIRMYNPWCRLIYISTFFVVGDPPMNPVNEDTICNPKGLYGATKLLAEQMCKIYANTFDLNISIARLTNVYGPGQKRANQKTAAFNWMVKQCVDNKEISLYDNGKIKRDYLYIEDAIRGIKTIKSVGDTGEVYFLSTGIGTSFQTMVQMMIAHAGGGKIRVVSSPGFHQRVGIGNFWADNTKAKILGWHPEIPINEGIRRTVEWYKNAVH